MIISLVITLLLGGMFSFLGWVIKSQNAGDMVSGLIIKKMIRKNYQK